MGRTKISPHQTGFNDVLALAQINGRAPETVVAIGVQPVELNDFGGSLRPPVRQRLAEAVRLAADQLAAWGFPGTPRTDGPWVAALNADPLALDAYESGDRPRRRLAATVIRDCSSAPPRTLADMCIGVPMKLMSHGTGAARSARAAASAKHST